MESIKLHEEKEGKEHFFFSDLEKSIIKRLLETSEKWLERWRGLGKGDAALILSMLQNCPPGICCIQSWRENSV